MVRTLILTLTTMTLLAHEPVVFAAGIDHAPYTRLLQTWVNQQGLVDYAGWRTHAADRAALDAYLAQYAGAPATAATGADRHAGLINLYNALTLRAVLQLPADATTFWKPKPFDQRIHRVGGIDISLDDIEHGAARPEIGFRAHAALICAAMSCPPLAREAFTADAIERQLDERMRVWLGREDLNRFDVQGGTAHLSQIFTWFREDFERGDSTLATTLAPLAPPAGAQLLSNPDTSIRFLDYDTSLNAHTP